MENENLQKMLHDIKAVRTQLGPPMSPYMEAVVSVLDHIEQKVEGLLTVSFTEPRGTLRALAQIEAELKLVWQCTDDACLHKHSADLDIALHSAPLAYLHSKAEETLQYLRTIKLFIRENASQV